MKQHWNPDHDFSPSGLLVSCGSGPDVQPDDGELDGYCLQRTTHVLYFCPEEQAFIRNPQKKHGVCFKPDHQ